MNRYLSRKSFVTSLAAGGLGLGVAVLASGRAGAQEADTAPPESPGAMMARFDELQAELYVAFTAALAEELGRGDAAQVDGGIRAALATVVDGYAGDDLVTPGQATALKALIATAEVPVGPGPMMGHDRMRVERIAGPGGPPSTEDATAGDVAADAPVDDRQAMAERFYPDFTAALASELGAGSADEVDGAIRVAMIAVIDGLEDDDLPLPIPTDALKAMAATAESPLGPGMLFGPAMGMSMRAFHGHGPGGPGFHGRGRDGDDGWFGERGERERGGNEDDRDPGAEPETDDDASADDESEDEGEASA